MTGIFQLRWGTLGVRFDLRLDQHDLTGFNVPQLFARFFLDGVGIFPLQAIDLASGYNNESFR